MTNRSPQRTTGTVAREKGASPALLGVAALIGIAATLEELVYRCLLFRLLERAWGTKVALVVQAVVFAVQLTAIWNVPVP